ncbi:MAG TPA: PhzF family phenazine biosynthesis protein [Ktedonobacterales bacterium]
MPSPQPALPFHRVDVFSAHPFSGNGLTVFPHSADLSAELMQRITQEMRQFESIFLAPTTDPGEHTARIFTMEEELDFAGHPLLGAAAVLHATLRPEAERTTWRLRLTTRAVELDSERLSHGYSVRMDQGSAHFGAIATASQRDRVLHALSLTEADQSPDHPMQMVSTGLPYLIVPVWRGLDHARIATPDFEALLGELGAKFGYVLDLATREGRSWDNAGQVEDIATGSAAGPAGAYLVRYGLAQAGEEITLAQGRYAGRPSQMLVRVSQDVAELRIEVSGGVTFVGDGELYVLG